MDNNELQRLRRLQQYIEDNESNRSIGLNSNHYVFKLKCQKIRQVINVIDIIVTLLERLNTEYDDKVYIEDIRVWINPNENHNSEDGIPIWFAYPTNHHNQSDCNDIFREEWGIDPVPFNTDKFENRLFWCVKSNCTRQSICNFDAPIDNNQVSIC